jgi:hypothetical protein
VKAQSTTTTRVVVHISTRELVEFVRASGIHVPDSVAAYPATPFDYDEDGVVLEWQVDHAQKQG